MLNAGGETIGECLSGSISRSSLEAFYDGHQHRLLYIDDRCLGDTGYSVQVIRGGFSRVVFDAAKGDLYAKLETECVAPPWMCVNYPPGLRTSWVMKISGFARRP
jgi:hypothetical protein